MDLQTIESLKTFDNFELLARQIVEGFLTGLHRSPFHGFSVEFAEHRPYNSGESTKNIDWKLFAKTDKLFCKQFEEETNVRCQLVIDTSSSMLFPFQEKSLQNKLAFSLYSAAALIHLLRRQRDAVGLTLFNNGVEVQTEAKLSETHAQRLYSELNTCLHSCCLETSFHKETSISESLNAIAEVLHKRSLVIIFSDFLQKGDDEELYKSLQHLKYNKHEVIVFHVVEPNKEQSFTFDNRPTELIDMETGEHIKLNPNAIRDSFSASMSVKSQQLKMHCEQYQIDYVQADINKGFHQVLLNYLVKRNKMM